MEKSQSHMNTLSFLDGIEAVARHRPLVVMVVPESERVNHSDVTRHLGLTRCYPQLTVINPGPACEDPEFWDAILSTGRVQACFLPPDKHVDEMTRTVSEMMTSRDIAVIPEGFHLTRYSGVWVCEESLW